MTLSTALTVTLALLGTAVRAQYTLKDDYTSGGNFFSMFSFFTAADPTGGFVQYVDQKTAQSAGYINATSNGVYIGTDHTNVASSSGRQSVRITSNKAYNSGLFVLDLAHMPGGECGTWPAFWTVGPNWPNSGEIDIIEGVNQQATNDMTLHTSQGCTITKNGAFSGSIATSDCWINDPNQSSNAGCSITTTNTQTYGAGFNAIGGGVYAMEFASNAITIWFFPRSSIPSDVSSSNPNPANWPTPVAQFQGGCNIPKYFVNQQIVFDLTFCGQWAGAVWSGSACSSLASTCNAYVQNNPSAFTSAYWQIKSLRVYQNTGAVSKIESTSGSSTSTSSSASLSASRSSSASPSSTSSTHSNTAGSSTGLSHSSAGPSAASTSVARSSASPSGSSTFATATSPVHSSNSSASVYVSSSASAIINTSRTIVPAGGSTSGEGPTATGSHVTGAAPTSSLPTLNTPAAAPTSSANPAASATSTLVATDHRGRPHTWYWQDSQPTEVPEAYY